MVTLIVSVLVFFAVCSLAVLIIVYRELRQLELEDKSRLEDAEQQR